jgi:hypothetical protein
MLVPTLLSQPAYLAAPPAAEKQGPDNTTSVTSDTRPPAEQGDVSRALMHLRQSQNPESLECFSCQLLPNYPDHNKLLKQIVTSYMY